METVQLQKKELINGKASNILCHVQHITAAGTVYPAHYHSYIELLYIISGSYELIVNNVHHLFHVGDLVIINSNEVHLIDSFNALGEYYVLRFEPEVIYSSMFDGMDDSGYMLNFLLGTYANQTVIPSKITSESFMSSAFKRIMQEFETQSYGFDLSIKIETEQIFLWILRYFHSKNPDTFVPSAINSEAAIHLKPCINYVALHYDEEMTSQSMAELCNLSVSYFSRIFNKLMRMTFHDYVNYVRIQEAEKLLLTTDKNVTEISLSVGFNTTSYFIKTFKGYKNISPKQYRKQFV